ncbi:MgtC/SapB family protein [Antrihabitans sp. YC2-6]|uniref:MgtC/SapB family protein n=1 Tax=Antrihabitans sp. YC2-6 TaxID=2799498 RepID=UPI0018F461C0|nr:MgtC/SapB family protein [Antrihabitans sp. YC2-6]MBJ8346401.1 MgtC/SapB family protein [Antrihabitans sp. YC2-6]
MLEALREQTGEGLTQVIELAVAFGLSALIGLERELKQKSAGIRTYTVVGFAAALWMLVSKYGFQDVLSDGTVIVDPSRVAAQIVAGVGFIGGGIIFVKRDSVRGLTTAAGIFLTAAIGACAGAGLVLLAAVATVAYFIAVLVLPLIGDFAKRHLNAPKPPIRVHFLDGRGLLHRIVEIVREAGFQIEDISVTQRNAVGAAPEQTDARSTLEVRIYVAGKGDVQSVVSELSELEGIITVSTVDDESDAY